MLRGDGDVAQLGEHLLCKEGVRGSSPLISTTSSAAHLRVARDETRSQGRWLTVHKAITLMLAAAIGVSAAACSSNKSPTASVSPRGSSGAHPSASPTYHPSIDPADFRAVVDNPWFPLKPGSVWVYQGEKDGESVRDVTVVTTGKQKINGVPCAVVKDQLFDAKGKLIEDTTDFYSQDGKGNVWYFGEVTVALDDHGNLTDTEGSWLAGQDGAQPGIFMEADPTVGHTHRQEYYPGHAEDSFKVLDLAAAVTTPLAAYPKSLLTEETTALEPGIVDHKNYVKGIGEVAELQVKGPKPPERLKLVSFTEG